MSNKFNPKLVTVKNIPNELTLSSEPYPQPRREKVFKKDKEREREEQAAINRLILGDILKFIVYLLWANKVEIK